MTLRILHLLRPTLSVAALLTTLGVASAQEVPPQSKIINEELEKGWKTAELKPSAKASDYEFCRRVFIDIVGRIPTAEEVRDYVEYERSPNKRIKLVQRLLYDKEYKPKNSAGGPVKVDAKSKDFLTFDYANEYARNFSNIWGVWLMTRAGVAEVYHDSMELWLEEQFSKNAPWNEMVKQLIVAKGKTNDNGAVAYVMSHLGERTSMDPGKQLEDGHFDAIPITSRTTKLFLGIQTNCIQCHDHPFNPEWKQDHFWGVNAFFRQVVRDATPSTREGNQGKKKMEALPVGLSDNPELNKSNRIFFERRSGIMSASRSLFLPNMADLEKEGAIKRSGVPSNTKMTRRELLADYITGHDNFAKAFVNRYWAHFFGRGMNELPAADDFGGHNKVVHAELLQKLGDELAKYNYDVKKLIEWICCSDAYALTYQANTLPEGKGGNSKPEADPYFSRMALKSMSPEVLFESLEVATRLDAAADKTAKANKKRSWMDKLSLNFGDDEGNEANFNGTIIQALLMMNGREINEEVSRKDGTGAVDRAMQKHKSGNSFNHIGVVGELYLMTLNRLPSGKATIPVPVIDPKTGAEKRDAKGKPIISGTISESTFLSQQIANMKSRGLDPKKFYEDIFWSLLNTSEFMLNH
jgi:Protein of unknown function (DUF1553)/Protein of unknown function (DUF1549)